MWLAALALVFAPIQAPADLTDQQAVEGFTEHAKDKKALPQHLEAGVQDLAKRFAASRERAQQALAALETKQGKASDWKKQLKAEEELQESIAEAIWGTFRWRKKVNQDNLALWRESVTAYSEMGTLGSEWLWKIFEEKRFSKEHAFLGRVIEKVGVTQDFDCYEDLLKLFNHHSHEVVIGSIKALGAFEAAPGKVRRECVEKMVRAMESYHSASDGGEDINGEKRYARVKDPLNRALQALTGAKADTSLAWVKFWNEYKNDKDLWSDRD